MGADVVGELLGEAAVVVEEELEGVDHDGHELDHLEVGDPRLPEEVGADPGAEGGEAVVGVHEDVDAGVEEAEEGGVAAGEEAVADPAGEGHDGVVDDVEDGHLVELFPEDEAELERGELFLIVRL